MAAPRLVRYSAFAASVYSLSLFFAGHRQINETGRIEDWALLLFGIVLTAALVGVQAYWIYFDEKGKGKLTKHIGLFEKIHQRIAAAQAKRALENETKKGALHK